MILREPLTLTFLFVVLFGVIVSTVETEQTKADGWAEVEELKLDKR